MVKAISDVQGLASDLMAKGILLVGVFGSAGLGALDIELQEPYFKTFLTELRRLLENPACAIKDVCIVNNGTSAGIPGMVVRSAHREGFPLLGICPKIGAELRLVRNDLLTWVRIVGEDWGDEEETILECISALVILGGQFGTLSLLTDLMNRNDHLVKAGRAPIPILTFAPPSVSSLVYQFIEEFLVKVIGSGELSRLGVEVATTSPDALAQKLVNALTI